MERIGTNNLIRNRLGAAADVLGFGCLAQDLAVGRRDFLDDCLVGQLLEQPLPQNFVDFVAGQIHRRDRPLLTTQFLSSAVERLVNQVRAGFIRRREVRDDDGHVCLLAGGRKHVGECAGGDIRHRPRPDLLRRQVMEVRRHLIQQNEDRTLVEQLQPVLLVWCFRPVRPEVSELPRLAELLRNLTPKEMIRAVATIEGSDLGDAELLAVRDVRAVLLAKTGVLGQQPKSDQQVGLTTAHRLLEMKDTLVGLARESLHALGNEGLHALGDEGLVEERGPVPLARNQFIELLDGITNPQLECIVLKDTGVFDGLHSDSSPVSGVRVATKAAPCRLFLVASQQCVRDPIILSADR